MPSTAFLAADGSVVEVRPGAFTASGLIEAIDENLGVEVTLSD